MSEVSFILPFLMLGIILMSVLGNLLVVLSVLLVRALRQPSNLLLLALAVTDLLVSLIVMPGALLQQLVGEWPLNDSICIAWVFADVFLCTSSILSLTAICIDRYLAISRPLRYVPVRTPRLIGCWIIAVNITAGLVSAPVIPAWNNSPDLSNSSNQTKISSSLCLVPQSPIYQLYATIVAFYLPLSVILILNTKVYVIARRIIEREKKSPSMSRHWLVDTNYCHYKQKARSADNIDKNKALSKEKFTRSMQSISPKVKKEKPPSTSMASGSMELTDDLEYEDLLVQTYSKDLNLESETTQMIFKDISEQRLSDMAVNDNGIHNSVDDKPKDTPDTLGIPESADMATSCKSVSVLNACQVLRLSDTSYCIRLANKQKSVRLQKNIKDKVAASCTNNCTNDPKRITKDEVPDAMALKDKGREEGGGTPLDRLTARTVNHARKLSKRLKQIQKREDSSNGCESCDKNENSDNGDYLTLVVGDKLASTELVNGDSEHDSEKIKRKDIQGSFEDGFPKSPSGRLTRYLSGSYARQEWKATLTVGIVVLTFLICWLPFFVLALVRPLAPQARVPDWVSSLTLWLGYANSMLNPIIYGVLHRDFRKTFIDLLSCNMIRDYYRAYKIKY